jgi:hypothetical protein
MFINTKTAKRNLAEACAHLLVALPGTEFTKADIEQMSDADLYGWLEQQGQWWNGEDWTEFTE